MTSEDSAWPRLRRALDDGDALRARAAAAELPAVALSEALELVVLIAEKEPDRLGRMALRWTIRYASEIRGVGPLEAQAVLALLLLMPARRHGSLCGLAGLLADRRELPGIAERLLRAAAGSDPSAQAI